MPAPTFKLTVDNIELTLIEFDGIEEMNRLFKYTFTTEVPSNIKSIVNIIDSDALFTICKIEDNYYDSDIEIPGYISSASKSNNKWILEFLPKVNRTNTNCRSEIHFNENDSLNAKTIIENQFELDSLLIDRDAIFTISDTLPNRKLFCQFNESNFNFIARLCDHWGFQFYFDHFNSTMVFADNSHYDQEFNITLKTTDATADNSPLKILDWQELILPTNSYTTIKGHDYENSGTQITASFPISSADQDGKTQACEIMQDINSQDEAEYIARIKQESKTCQHHLATGETKLPYLFPGFIIDTDDSDFSKALVIRSASQARNLNARRSGKAPSYSCQFSVIPSSVCFRPTPHYPVPVATNAIGKVISETDVITQAQRNAMGDYKAELLGFENESSLHPWLRKAQTTAGTNSVDVPLTPNTEVLIAFFDNNPNCPYIQHALENSLNPVPVTNANPHHAVIATNGTLITSSLLGRQNYSTTKTHTEASDASISSSIKNYFKGRGDFSQHTAFIDPSSNTTLAFTKEEEASGEYIFTRHYGDSVEIREGDKLHWHNGNLYDFGGYWNYNLGNSYEENYLNQASQLNQIASPFSGADVTVADILKTGGPAFEEVVWPTIASVSGDNDDDTNKADFAGSEHPFPKPAATSDLPFYKDNVNTSKTFLANSYEFSSQCNSVEISDRCNSLEITHKDSDTKTVEATFKGGRIRSLEKNQHRYSLEKKWGPTGKLLSRSETTKSPSSGNFEKIETKEKSWTIDGKTKVSDTTKTIETTSITTDEKSYNMDTGALATHNITKSDGMGSNVMDFSYAEVNTSAFNFGGERKFSIEAQGTASLAISMSGAIDIGIEASLKLDMKMNASMTIEMELDAAGKIEISNDGFQYSGNGLTAKIAPALGIKKEVTKLEQTEIKLNKSIMELANIALDLDQANVKLDTSYLVVFS